MIILTVAANIKQTIASLKGTEGTLRMYSIQTQNKNVKAAYREAVHNIDKIIIDLEDRLKTLEFEEPQYKGN